LICGSGSEYSFERMGGGPLPEAGFHPLGEFGAGATVAIMQTKLALNSATVLDETNARHVRAALGWLEARNVAEACKEIRLIRRIFANHPAVIRVRQRLVAVVCGWEDEKQAVEGELA